MNEEQLLDKALAILDQNGANEAYNYLLSNKGLLHEHSSQLYNFLYCLSAVIGMKDESLAWIREAIIDKGYWYRPDVFEDDDLDSIRYEAKFLEYKKISDEKYYEALKTTKTLCTWEETKSTKLALVLHGNQQNMYSDKEHWKYLEKDGYQVEYIQSKVIDSYMLYRWEDDGEVQLDDMIEKVSWEKYDTRVLCGFSAGCNEILKTLLKTGIECEKIILQSPWIPVIDDNLDSLLDVLSNVSIEINCGLHDEDCLPNAKKFADEAVKQGLNCKLQIIDGLGHSYPVDIITTSRLLIRRFKETDTEQYIRIMTNPAVTKYLGSGDDMTSEDVLKLLANFEAAWNDGYGVFAVTEIVSGDVIGHCGIKPIGDGRIEILYAYAPSTWGKGYATEAGSAVFDYAKKNFTAAKEIIAMSYPQNNGSVAVIEKLGFKNVGQEEHFGNLLDVFSIDLTT